MIYMCFKLPIYVCQLSDRHTFNEKGSFYSHIITPGLVYI